MNMKQDSTSIKVSNWLDEFSRPKWITQTSVNTRIVTSEGLRP